MVTTGIGLDEEAASRICIFKTVKKLATPNGKPTEPAASHVSRRMRTSDSEDSRGA